MGWLKIGRAVNLGKVFGIQLRLHYSWFMIFTLLTFMLVSPHWFSLQWWLIAVVTCLLFFGSVIAHELAHSLIGRANGIPVKSITLFIFGGVAHMTKEAARPNAELKMAAAGPLCSLAIGGVFGLLFFLNPGMPVPVTRMFQWLMIMNFGLAIFNLIPGFPLDGGRLFRSVLWRSTGDYKRSTRIATQVGRGIGYSFIVAGIVIAVLSIFGLPPFGLSWFSGIWIAFVGWFLQNAASTSYRQIQWREALKMIPAVRIMTTNFPVVPSDFTINQAFQQYVIPTGCRFFMVADEGRLGGMVAIQNIRPNSKQNWGVIPVKEVMIPIDKLKIAYPGQDALSVLEQMEEGNINGIPVVSGDRVIGLITRDNVVNFLRTCSEFK